MVFVEGNQLHAVIDDQGTEASGFPVTLGSDTLAPPAIGDVAGDPANELVVTDGDGDLYVVDASGATVAGWPQRFDTMWPHQGAALVDLDGDPQLELVAAVGTRVNLVGYRQLVAVNSDTTAVPGWPPDVLFDRTDIWVAAAEAPWRSRWPPRGAPPDRRHRARGVRLQTSYTCPIPTAGRRVSSSAEGVVSSRQVEPGRA